MELPLEKKHVGTVDFSTPTEDEKNPALALENALAAALAGPNHLAPVPTATKIRTITKRGVMWLGQTCNLRCYFCYFLDRIETKEHPEHAFMDLEKAKHICTTLSKVYGNNAIDIQGGEPTIWKPIHELIKHCRSLGMFPTLITNALVLDNIDTCRAFQASGIGDFLISVHGLGEVHDRVVVREGAHARQMKAIRNLRELGIPFRLNCVLSKPVVNQLPQIAEFTVKVGAPVINFLTFNPFEDQAKGGKRSAENVPTYSELAVKLKDALDILDRNRIEANVRYLPFCMLEERHWKSNYNFQQLPYDHNEWDYASWAWTGMQPQRMRDGPTTEPVPMVGQKFLFPIRKKLIALAIGTTVGKVLARFYRTVGRMVDSLRNKDDLYREIAKVHAHTHSGYVHVEACEKCDLRGICDGLHGDYARIFGGKEVKAISVGHAVEDSKRYIADQSKYE